MKYFILFISLFILSACDNNKTQDENNNEHNQQQIKYNEYEVDVDKKILTDGLIVKNLLHLENQDNYKNTRFKYTISNNDLQLKYTIICTKFDDKNNYCSESNDILLINDKEVIVEKNKYSTDQFPNYEEKFLTYLKIINDKYIVIVTGIEFKLSTGNLYIYDLEGNKKYEDIKNLVTDNYFRQLSEDGQGQNFVELRPIIENNSIIYYNCDNDKKEVYKNSVSVDTFESFVETIPNCTCLY